MNFVKLRDLLLKENKENEYTNIVEFMTNPLVGLEENTILYLRDNGWDSFESDIREWHKNNTSDYVSKVLKGQVIIWQEVIIAYRELTKTYEALLNHQVVVYRDNYLKATDQVKSVLKIYSDAKSSITKLECHLGVDRYLDSIAEEEFTILIEKFNSIHKLVETKLDEYKSIFTISWNTGNVCETVLHKLINLNMDNQICSLVQGNKKRVILFIIDGFGLGQYFWSKQVVPENVNLAYSDNIFGWLKEKSLLDEYVLGAPLVTDTAAGLAQIFTGKTAKYTRIISSTVKKTSENYPTSVKRITQGEYKRIINDGPLSFTVDVASEKDVMNIYYCSKYNENDVSGFSKHIFDGAKVTSIIPPERVFSVLREEANLESEGAYLIYITTIDNSGHTMGSFSQFERYEHEKINQLFRNYLIDMAKKHEDFFDGNTSILITADHGMTESYRINISKTDIIGIMRQVNEKPRIVEANRAEFIYGITKGQEQVCVTALQEWFDDRKIDALILTHGDPLFEEMTPQNDPNYDNTTPDIIIFLISEGIFYSKDVGDNLMHFGGHGGRSVDEVFVPLINIEMNSKLYGEISNRFLNLL